MARRAADLSVAGALSSPRRWPGHGRVAALGRSASPAVLERLDGQPADRHVSGSEHVDHDHDAVLDPAGLQALDEEVTEAGNQRRGEQPEE